MHMHTPHAMYVWSSSQVLPFFVCPLLPLLKLVILMQIHIQSVRIFFDHTIKAIIMGNIHKCCAYFNDQAVLKAKIPGNESTQPY